MLTFIARFATASLTSLLQPDVVFKAEAKAEKKALSKPININAVQGFPCIT